MTKKTAIDGPDSHQTISGRSTERNQSTLEHPTNDPALLQSLSEKGVLTLTLNRPLQFNALSHTMLDALLQALDSIDNESTRVVIIAANGKAFCAGHDLKEMRAHIDQQWQEQLFNKCSTFMQKLLNLQQPVIAKVQGIAAAAGCQLVANCDLAMAADHCEFGVSGINLGLFCSTPSVALSRNLSRKRAFQMLMTGEFIDTDTAIDWGLINEAVPLAELDAAVDSLCDTICSKSKIAVTTGKKLFYKQLEQPMDEAYKLAANAMACNMMAGDVSEGIDAFFEKRKPEWNDN